MNIIVNANDDKLTIEVDKAKPIEFDLKKLRVSPYELKNILEEILGSINYKNLVDYYGVSLEYIDEDTRRTVGEW
jgi:hypothetical protein